MLERSEILQHFSFLELDDILHLNKIINDRKSGQKLLSDSVYDAVFERMEEPNALEKFYFLNWLKI